MERKFSMDEIHSVSKDGRSVMVVMVRNTVRHLNGKRIVQRQSFTRHLRVEANGGYSGMEMRYDKKQKKWVPVKYAWECVKKKADVQESAA